MTAENALPKTRHSEAARYDRERHSKRVHRFCSFTGGYRSKKLHKLRTLCHGRRKAAHPVGVKRIMYCDGGNSSARFIQLFYA